MALGTASQTTRQPTKPATGTMMRTTEPLGMKTNDLYKKTFFLVGKRFFVIIRPQYKDAVGEDRGLQLDVFRGKIEAEVGMPTVFGPEIAIANLIAQRTFMLAV